MNKTILNRAIRNDAEPTPGYILEEVVQMSFSSSSACGEIEACLFKALGHNFKGNDVYVKLKALRVIKHICEKGNPEFRLSVQKNSSIIKQFMLYTCDRDPLHGDGLIRQVRAEAEKCISALYGDESYNKFQRENGHQNSTHSTSQFYRYVEESDSKFPSSQSTINVHNNNNITGIEGTKNKGQLSSFHNNQLSSSSSSTSPTTGISTCHAPTIGRYGKMEGFGNPYFTDSRISDNNVNPTVTTISHVVASQAENIVVGLAQAASAVGKYLPYNVKAHLDSITDKFSLPPSSIQSSHNSSYYHPNYNQSSNSDYSWNSCNSEGSSATGNINFSNRFRFSGTPEFRQNKPSLTTTTEISSKTASQLHTSHFSKHHTSGELNNLKDHTNSSDDGPILILIDLIESATDGTAGSIPPRSVLADFVRRCRLYPHPTDVIPLLLAKLSNAVSQSNQTQHIIVPATTWRAKIQVISLLGALLDSSFIDDVSERQNFAKAIINIGIVGIQDVCQSMPKCRMALNDLLKAIENLTGEQTFLQNADHTSNDTFKNNLMSSKQRNNERTLSHVINLLDEEYSNNDVYQIKEHLNQHNINGEGKKNDISHDLLSSLDSHSLQTEKDLLDSFDNLTEVINPNNIVGSTMSDSSLKNSPSFVPSSTKQSTTDSTHFQNLNNFCHVYDTAVTQTQYSQTNLLEDMQTHKDIKTLSSYASPTTNNLFNGLSVSRIDNNVSNVSDLLTSKVTAQASDLLNHTPNNFSTLLPFNFTKHHQADFSTTLNNNIGFSESPSSSVLASNPTHFQSLFVSPKSYDEKTLCIHSQEKPLIMPTTNINDHSASTIVNGTKDNNKTEITLDSLLLYSSVSAIPPSSVKNAQLQELLQIPMLSSTSGKEQTPDTHTATCSSSIKKHFNLQNSLDSSSCFTGIDMMSGLIPPPKASEHTNLATNLTSSNTRNPTSLFSFVE